MGGGRRPSIRIQPLFRPAGNLNPWTPNRPNPNPTQIEPSADEDPGQLERRRIDQIREPEFLADLADLPLKELRVPARSG